jgi:hypothetical protein
MNIEISATIGQRQRWTFTSIFQATVFRGFIAENSGALANNPKELSKTS